MQQPKRKPLKVYTLTINRSADYNGVPLLFINERINSVFKRIGDETMFKAVLMACLLTSPIQVHTGVIADSETIDSRCQYWEYDTRIAQGENVAVVFNTNGTTIIEDDIIIVCTPID